MVWNGPFGAFEMTPFDAATVAVARYVGDLTHNGRLLSVAGGGDTVAALSHAGTAERFSYVSTAGGAASSSGSRARRFRAWRPAAADIALRDKMTKIAPARPRCCR